ncbi:bleomycin resistance protein [Bacillus sp. SA1-12]|uniref:glyoxalase superfamily protein n=1 Tax=Bacillus sp. SA1-12 TaxID=1455638 RepID=UPI00062735F7|nr:glyoxalase superfamily protein [Bacillus sp. SA1-12]KKI90649.1 bleomycin resistance protein [Bacillus sp. SA1-12]
MITPIFRIFDLEKAKEFYIEYLGFQLDWTHRFETDMLIYCQVSLNDLILHLSEHHGDCSPGSAIRIKMTDLKKFHSILKEKNYKYAKPGLEKSPWNTVELTVNDPFFNRITFYEEIL